MDDSSPAGWFRDISILIFFNFPSPKIFLLQKKNYFCSKSSETAKKSISGGSILEEGGGPEWCSEHRTLEYIKIFHVIDHFLKKKNSYVKTSCGDDMIRLNFPR